MHAAAADMVFLLQNLTKQQVAGTAKQLNDSRQTALAVLRASQGSDMPCSLQSQICWFHEQCVAALGGQS